MTSKFTKELQQRVERCEDDLEFIILAVSETAVRTPADMALMNALETARTFLVYSRE